MRVFIGCHDIASILTGLAEGFEESGHTVTRFVFGTNKFYPQLKYDIIVEPSIEKTLRYTSKSFPGFIRSILSRIDNQLLSFKLKRMTPSLISGHDLFVFIWQPWLEESVIYKKLKQHNKKIICIHLGSEVRHISAYVQEFNEDVNVWENFLQNEDVNDKIRKMRLDEIYADQIYSVPDQAGLAIRPYKHIFLPISRTKKLEFYIPSRKQPKLIHAPSRSGIKGTKYILAAVEKLKKEGYEFEFELVENVPNEVLLKKLTDADVLVDELFLHGPGVLGMEAMFSGCAVITRTLQEHKNIFDPPVLNANPENIYGQIKILLDQPDLIIEMAKKGLEYVKKYNVPVNITSKIIRDIESAEEDYYPRFFIEQYTATGLTKESKQLNKTVLEAYHNSDADKTLLHQRGLI